MIDENGFIAACLAYDTNDDGITRVRKVIEAYEATKASTADQLVLGKQHWSDCKINGYDTEEGIKYATESECDCGDYAGESRLENEVRKDALSPAPIQQPIIIEPERCIHNVWLGDRCEDCAAMQQPVGLTIEDYETAFADHRRLVRELDIALNGETGAAEQASLCDIVAQVKATMREAQQPVEQSQFRILADLITQYLKSAFPNLLLNCPLKLAQEIIGDERFLMRELSTQQPAAPIDEDVGHKMLMLVSGSVYWVCNIDGRCSDLTEYDINIINKSLAAMPNNTALMRRLMDFIRSVYPEMKDEHDRGDGHFSTALVNEAANLLSAGQAYLQQERKPHE